MVIKYISRKAAAVSNAEDAKKEWILAEFFGVYYMELEE